MKDFQAFIHYLDQKSNNEDSDESVLGKTYMIDSLTPENFAAYMAQYSEDILRAAGVMTMYYLQTYHEWLQTQS